MFGTLYRYELKKILTRPYVLLLLVLMLGVTIFLNVKPLLAQEEVAYAEEDGTLVFDTVSRYEAIQLERRFSQEDTGCLLDNEAALEMRELNLSYQESATVPTFLLLNRFLVQDGIATTYFNPLWDGTDQMADLTYKAIAYTQEEEYQNQRLTQEEIDYWETERAGITTPYTLDYAKGYSGILSMARWLNLMVLPLCLSACAAAFPRTTCIKPGPSSPAASTGGSPWFWPGWRQGRPWPAASFCCCLPSPPPSSSLSMALKGRGCPFSCWRWRTCARDLEKPGCVPAVGS